MGSKIQTNISQYKTSFAPVAIDDNDDDDDTKRYYIMYQIIYFVMILPTLIMTWLTETLTEAVKVKKIDKMIQ